MEIPRGNFQLHKHLAELRTAVELEHDCVAAPLVTMPVTVTVDDFAWRGMVAAFDLHDHLFANRCYAWPVIVNGTLSSVTMLKAGPITSAEEAVREWLHGIVVADTGKQHAPPRGWIAAVRMLGL